MIEWIDNCFIQNVSLENALALREWRLNYLNKPGLVKGNFVLIYALFTYLKYAF